MKIQVDQIMYSNFIKYDKMRDLTRYALGWSDSNHLNVFIDMYSILRPLTNPDVMIIDYTVLSACVINMCAHIREYYNTRHHVNTSIYIVYSENTPTNSKIFYNGYNEVRENAVRKSAHMNEFIYTNREILKTICPYLDGIYYIEDTFETAVVIHDIIRQLEERSVISPNMIISRDIYMMQLPAIRENTVIFRPCKTEDGDMSYAITNANVLDRYLEDTNRTNPVLLKGLSPRLLSLIMSLSNLPCRNITSLFNITKSASIIRHAISNMTLLNDYNSEPAYKLDIMNQSLGKVNASMVDSRFKAIDLIFQHGVYLNTANSTTNMKSVIDLYDPDTVRAINNQYFKENPLDLNRL